MRWPAHELKNESLFVCFDLCLRLLFLLLYCLRTDHATPHQSRPTLSGEQQATESECFRVGNRNRVAGLFLGKDQQAPFRDRVRITGFCPQIKATSHFKTKSSWPPCRLQLCHGLTCPISDYQQTIFWNFDWMRGQSEPKYRSVARRSSSCAAHISPKSRHVSPCESLRSTPQHAPSSPACRVITCGTVGPHEYFAMSNFKCFLSSNYHSRLLMRCQTCLGMQAARARCGRNVRHQHAESPERRRTLGNAPMGEQNRDNPGLDAPTADHEMV